MIARIRAWWDACSPWRIAARAEINLLEVAWQLKAAAAEQEQIDREFTAYINWASVEIEARDLTIADHASRLRDAQAAHARHQEDLSTSMRETAQALLERNRARNTAVQLEQQLAALTDLTRLLLLTLAEAPFQLDPAVEPDLTETIGRIDAHLRAIDGRGVRPVPRLARDGDLVVDFRAAS